MRELMKRHENNTLRLTEGVSRIWLPKIRYLPEDSDSDDESKYFVVSMDEYHEVTDMFAQEMLKEFQPKDVHFKNAVTKEWELLDFARYCELQNAWRARLQCSSLKHEMLVRRCF